MKRREFIGATLAGAALSGVAAAEQDTANALSDLKSMTADVKPLELSDYEKRIDKARCGISTSPLCT